MIEAYDVHVPAFRGTATDGWEPPDSDDVPTLAALGDRHLLSTSGFPPDSAADLALPVVDTEGRLHRIALLRARRELRERTDVTVSTSTTAIAVVDRLLERAFADEDETTNDAEMTGAEATLADLSAPSMDEEAREVVDRKSSDPLEDDERQEPHTR